MGSFSFQYLHHENYNEFVRLYENNWKVFGLGTVIFIVSYLLLVPLDVSYNFIVVFKRPFRLHSPRKEWKDVIGVGCTEYNVEHQIDAFT